MFKENTLKVCRYFFLVFTITFLFPSISFAKGKFGVSGKVGWFIPDERNSYGAMVVYDAEKKGAIQFWGIGRPVGFLQLAFTGGWFWDNGLGLELSTRTPYMLDVSVEGFTWSGEKYVPETDEYERIIWPFFSVTARYDLFKNFPVNPYAGAGIGGYLLTTSVKGDYGSGGNSGLIGGIHLVGGLQFRGGFHLEIRAESTSNAPRTSKLADDGRNLGGIFISFGRLWR